MGSGGAVAGNGSRGAAPSRTPSRTAAGTVLAEAGWGGKERRVEVVLDIGGSSFNWDEESDEDDDDDDGT